MTWEPKPVMIDPPLRASRRSVEYRMINSIKISNYRSFPNVEIDDCRRVNIVVGENGSGKTTLLEAIFLAAGVSPEIAVRTKTWRGLESIRAFGSRQDFHETFWSDLFFKFETSKAAVVRLKGAGDENRTVTVTLNKAGKVSAIPPERGKPYQKVRVRPDIEPIEFKWRIQGYPDLTVRPTVDQEGKLIFPSVPARHVRGALFAATRTTTNTEMIHRFSKITRTFSDEPFLKIYRDIYPRIESLSLELAAGSPMVYADVTGLPEKIPLGMASGGMNKLAALMLAMNDQDGGVILVDEMENGFYHRKLPQIWRALITYAEMNGCQLFVSTHSDECLRAAAEIAKERPNDFCVIQTVMKDGATEVNHFGGEDFAMAIADNTEIR